MTDHPVAPLSDTAIARIESFARSGVFDRTFADGMTLVEEAAAYLDGPGRAAAKTLPRVAALAYAGESMRLTTRLMQVASWLLVQRAVRDGELPVSEAASDRYRLRLANEPTSSPPQAASDLPEGLQGLIARASALYERVQRMDEDMYGQAAVRPHSLDDQVARLRAAFGGDEG